MTVPLSFPSSFLCAASALGPPIPAHCLTSTGRPNLGEAGTCLGVAWSIAGAQLWAGVDALRILGNGGFSEQSCYCFSFEGGEKGLQDSDERCFFFLESLTEGHAYIIWRVAGLVA